MRQLEAHERRIVADACLEAPELLGCPELAVVMHLWLACPARLRVHEQLRPRQGRVPGTGPGQVLHDPARQLEGEDLLVPEDGRPWCPELPLGLSQRPGNAF